MIRRAFLYGMTIIGIVVIATGCSASFEPKTVVIPDSELSAEPEQASDDFTVGQLYRLLDSEDATGEVLGWADKDHLLGSFWQSGQKRSFELMDYARNARKQLLTEGGKGGNYSLSPDGRQLVEYVSDGKSEKLRLIRTDGGKPASADLSDFDYSIMRGPFKWSNNSRFFAILRENREKAAPEMIVYDTREKRFETFAIRDGSGGAAASGTAAVVPSEQRSAGTLKIDESSFVEIADDGKSALVVAYKYGQPYLLFGSLADGEFISRYERPVSAYSNAEFVDDDQVMYVGSKGSLYLYDSRNETTAMLLEGIGMFRMSADRKYIAYTKDQDLYAARLQGNNLTNAQSVYKGAVALTIEWSPDNGKLLLDGRSLYSTPVADTKVDALPLVLEFKR